ncbi:MAG: YdcF family protein [Rhodospirillaceae bacterium]|jgi:uncharacterized SAM-binding protein YcdF (DUF218 family)|nr:YdcF family protein [Rhodospirillaceae bacterium]MBT4939358.1 YdcF family protein [Rhodospirillaceae bacterium]MBT7267037.1 YdcF family protein [Rhodospirillaceae bacterium]
MNSITQGMFFYLSKILWFFADPGNLLLIALCVAAGLAWTKWLRAAKIVLTVTVICCVLVTVLPIGSWVINHLENRFPRVEKLPKNITGIIVLGGVVDQFVTDDRKQIAINGAVERLTELARLSFLYPKAKLIFSGGSGVIGNQRLKEADVINPLLVTLGLNPNRIIFDSQARNTAENATLPKKIVKPTLDQRWLIITSAFHMPRAMGSFRQAGWNAIAYPVDYHTKSNPGLGLGLNLRSGLGGLSAALHEMIGLTFYWLTGRTNELYPKP